MNFKAIHAPQDNPEEFARLFLQRVENRTAPTSKEIRKFRHDCDEEGIGNALSMHHAPRARREATKNEILRSFNTLAFEALDFHDGQLVEKANEAIGRIHSKIHSIVTRMAESSNESVRHGIADAIRVLRRLDAAWLDAVGYDPLDADSDA